MFGKGLIPDKHDSRDFSFRHVARQLQLKSGLSKLPEEVDLRDIMSPIRNQSEIGSCTAFAVSVGLMESVQMESFGDVMMPLSPLFLYYNTRRKMRTINQDSGASLRDAIKTAATVGVCAEEEWPYDISRWKDLPPPLAYDNINKTMVVGYYRCESLLDIKRAVASKNPVVFGLLLFESFESSEVALTGRVQLPDFDKEQSIGGHALCICGYSDKAEHVIIRNSWGTSWGDDGYCYIPYKMFDRKLEVAFDFWTCTWSN